MDAFCEQIIKIKKTKKMIAALVFIWVFAIALTAFCILIMKRIPFAIFLAAATIYGAYRLIGQLNIEYEYIITNGDVDIDKIVNKSSRKNVVSFSCKDVEEIEKYSPGKEKASGVKTYVCTDDFQNAFVFKLSLPTLGRCNVVLSPNEKTIENMKRFIPRMIYDRIF